MLKKLSSVCLTALFLVFVSGFNLKAGAAVLSSQTPVLLQADSSISETTNKAGDVVKLYVVNPVFSNSGTIVLPAGTQVNAKISKLETKKRIGRPAEMILSEFSATLYDGRQILFNGNISQFSESRMARSIILGMIFPLFLLMKGASVELPAGSRITVYPAVDYSF